MIDSYDAEKLAIDLVVSTFFSTFTHKDGKMMFLFLSLSLLNNQPSHGRRPGGCDDGGIWQHFSVL